MGQALVGVFYQKPASLWNQSRGKKRKSQSKANKVKLNRLQVIVPGFQLMRTQEIAKMSTLPNCELILYAETSHKGRIGYANIV